jgi:hypothetical protein
MAPFSYADIGCSPFLPVLAGRTLNPRTLLPASSHAARCQVRDFTDRTASLYSTSLNNSTVQRTCPRSRHFSRVGPHSGLELRSAQNFSRASKSSNSIS